MEWKGSEGQSYLPWTIWTSSSNLGLPVHTRRKGEGKVYVGWSLKTSRTWVGVLYKVQVDEEGWRERGDRFVGKRDPLPSSEDTREGQKRE